MALQIFPEERMACCPYPAYMWVLNTSEYTITMDTAVNLVHLHLLRPGSD